MQNSNIKALCLRHCQQKNLASTKLCKSLLTGLIASSVLGGAPACSLRLRIGAEVALPILQINLHLHASITRKQLTTSEPGSCRSTATTGFELTVRQSIMQHAPCRTALPQACGRSCRRICQCCP